MVVLYDSPLDVGWLGGGAMDRCLHCGRKVRRDRLWVHSADGSAFAPPDATEEEIVEAGAYPMGFFPIGPDCAKALGIPPEYLVRVLPTTQ